MYYTSMVQYVRPQTPKRPNQKPPKINPEVAPKLPELPSIFQRDKAPRVRFYGIRSHSAWGDARRPCAAAAP